MLFSISKRSGSHRELKKNKKIKEKVLKKNSYSSSNSSSNDYDYPLSSDSEWDKRRQPTERKEKNKLDYVVTNNITNKDQCNDGIEYDPKFDGKLSLSRGNM